MVLLPAGTEAPADPTPDPAIVQRFTATCVPCHGEGGRGVTGLGANMTDDNYRHVKTLADIDRVMREGVPGTAMVSQIYSIPTDQWQAMIQYVALLRGTNAPSGQPPYGPLIPPFEDPLTGIASPLAHSKVLAPKTVETIAFEAPAKPGTYLLQCTLNARKAWRAQLVVK
ncbi:MAG: c-type cytochrome [Planctomycetota bacterium]